MTISEVAKIVSLTPVTLRYYERVGYYRKSNVLAMAYGIIQKKISNGSIL